MFRGFQRNVGLSTVVHSSGWFRSLARLVCCPAQYLNLNRVFGSLESLYCLVMGGNRKASSIYLQNKEFE